MATDTRRPSPRALDPHNLHQSLLTLVLRVSVWLGGAVGVPSVWLAICKGLHVVVIVDTVGLLALVALYVAERLPFHVRAVAVCLVGYAIGVGLMSRVGPVAQLYLIGASIVAVLLLGVRAGLAVTMLSAASIFAFGVLGWAGSDAYAAGAFFDVGGWGVVTLNFAVVATLLTLAVGVVVAAVESALAREIETGRARRQAEAERDRLLAQLQVQIERMPIAYVLSDKNFLITRFNPAAEAMFGYSEAEVLGKHALEVTSPAGSNVHLAGIFDRLTGPDAAGEIEARTKSGAAIVCEWHNTPLFDERGAFSGVLGLASDVTQRKSLEAELRQAQKMDAVGQLAGGVAHDFNNLLSVILGFSDLLLGTLPPDDPAREDIEEIRRAGARATDLTRQLLTFSRQEVVETKILDLNQVLSGVDKMLRRVVGEDIELASIPGTALGHVRADPGSVEQIIMNLTVNARDAMPRGGKLTLETANVDLDDAYARTHLGATAGPYVMLSVSDTGTGMDEATLARIFEPFFTTKEKGRGTGLGLSTVFGIVERSGGTVWVHSEPGIGTTFKVYLPRVDEEPQAACASLRPATLRGTETILLVEDEDQVREVTSDILRRHGYRVLDARNAGEAILLSEQHTAKIDLLLSDVVMPKMNGPALAKRLALARPELRVLCMSGYTDDAAVRHGVVGGDLAYLQKPITVDTLTRKVRMVLDAA